MNQEQTKILNRGQLFTVILTAEEHAVFPLLVTGTSMQPFLLNRRSVVYLEKDRTYQPLRGDIVFFFRADGSIVLHRVLRVLPDGRLIINGDAQRWVETIHPKQVLAHVTHFVRKKRDISVQNRFYRFLVRLWMPLRRIHPLLARVYHIWCRIPYKLFPKLMNKKQ